MNELNSDYLGAVLEWYKSEGWTFMTAPQALLDEVYALEDEYVGPYGWSWLRRVKLKT